MMTREWQFKVSAETQPGEVVCVVGNCQELGSWYHNKAVVLTKEVTFNENRSTWSGIIVLPADVEIQYRYFTCIILEPSEENPERIVIIRKWETNLNPRKISAKAGSNRGQTIPLELFGTYDGETKHDRGWLTRESVIQLKFFYDPIQMWKKNLKDKLFRIKVTPVDYNSQPNTPNEVTSPGADETSLDIQDLRMCSKPWPIVEVAAMNERDCEFALQEQFGRLFEPGDFVVFQSQVLNPESTTFLIDLYLHDPAATKDGSPPKHIGFCYVIPTVMKDCEGCAVVPITNDKHQPIGQLKVDYLFVRPIWGYQCDMSISYIRHWKHTWKGLEVGHRGAGSSFKDAYKSCASIRENTIASLVYAARHGADMLEFDVQLSKDLVPVIYHDFYVYIAMKKKLQNSGGEHDLLQLPVKDLTHEQLKMLKVYNLKESGSGSKFNDDDFMDHQPFPTLKEALEHIDPHVGFNIELKWTMQLKDGTYELYHPFELNLYLDTMLKVVLEHGEARRIVFSCFHPDICTMLRLKQNKYPVLFLTQGITSKYQQYHDPRSHSIPMGIYFALSAGILGINVHSEDLLRDPSQVAKVRSKGLILFCWGEDNNDQETIRYLKSLGLDGIIYDKIDVYSLKETKESIFLMEARETQRQLMQVAASVDTGHAADPLTVPPMPSAAAAAAGHSAEASSPVPSNGTYQSVMKTA